MDSVTRRGFIKTTSFSAAAISVLAALPTIAFADDNSTGAAASDDSGSPQVAPTLGGASAPAPALSAGPFMIYIKDASTGEGTILIDEQAIPFTDPSIVQRLQQDIA